MFEYNEMKPFEHKNYWILTLYNIARPCINYAWFSILMSHLFEVTLGGHNYFIAWKVIKSHFCHLHTTMTLDILAIKKGSFCSSKIVNISYENFFSITHITCLKTIIFVFCLYCKNYLDGGGFLYCPWKRFCKRKKSSTLFRIKFFVCSTTILTS